MALNWNWEDKMGTCTKVLFKGTEREERYTLDVYDCNGLYVAIYEYLNDDGKEMYSVSDFAVDETHFKNCLGFSKEFYSDKNFIEEFNLDVKYKSARKMAKILISAQEKGKWNGTLTTFV